MAHADMEKWSAEAEKIRETDAPLSVPLDVLVSEAVDLAKFVKTYWEPTSERPGLTSAGGKLSLATADEILSIRAAVQEAETGFLLSVETREPASKVIERGKFVLNEITATLEWLLDDDVTEEADHQLAALKQAHEDDTGRAGVLAQVLHDYATLARPLAPRMGAVGGFDPALIDEAFRLVDELGGVSAKPPALNDKAQHALRLRNRLIRLLQGRVALVRAAARFVYRAHPEIARQTTSAYERRRRAESRRRALVGKAKPSVGAVPVSAPHP